MDLKDLQRKLNNIRKNIGSQKTMQDVADQMSETVKTRTKSGKGVSKNGGNTDKLKPLKASTKARRRRLRASGDLSGETTPDKSNLTQRGEMINSVKGKGSKNLAEISVIGEKNKNKAENQANNGRTFMNLSKSEIKKAVNIIEEDIKKDIIKQGL